MANQNSWKNGIVTEPFVVQASGLQVKATLERPLDEQGLPVVLAPGWSEGQTALTGLRHALAELGRPAITLEPPRDFGGHLLDAGTQRARNIHSVLKKLKTEYGYEQFDFLAHSMGGIDTITAAKVDGDKMNHIVLAGSAGLIEGDTPLAILARLTGSVLREESRHFIENPISELRMASQGLWNVAANLIRSTSEGIHAGSTDIRDDITKLGQEGLDITRMQFLSDSVFPVHKVEHSMASHKHHTKHHFYIPHAGHNATAHYPKEVAQSITTLVDDLRAAV
jgi:pimeloyl-ACP methyl ester carboxylesterase